MCGNNLGPEQWLEGMKEVIVGYPNSEEKNLGKTLEVKNYLEKIKHILKEHPLTIGQQLNNEHLSRHFSFIVRRPIEEEGYYPISQQLSRFNIANDKQGLKISVDAWESLTEVCFEMYKLNWLGFNGELLLLTKKDLHLSHTFVILLQASLFHL